MALGISTIIAIYMVSQCLTLHISITEAENVSSISFELDGRNHVELDGDAVVTEKKEIQLTDSSNGMSVGSAGRVAYESTIPLGNSNFTTHFQFRINWTSEMNGSDDYGGDGLAFFMASPETGYHLGYRTDGGWLGLFNPKNNGNSTNHLVAVEFDTYNSSWDKYSNHIGIDVNNITSEFSVPLTQTLTNGKIWDARIEYCGQANMLTVSAGSEGKIAGNFSHKINLTRYLPPDVVVGFSAASIQSSEVHRLISWNFTCVTSRSFGKKKKSWIVVITVSFVISVAALFVTFVCYCYIRRKRETAEGMEEEEQYDMDIELGHVARKFTYSELSSGTSNFSEEKRLGRGAFGDVYKCILVQSNEIVAVKRLTAGSKQGKKEYVAEISTITRLRHRNLVQLLGWCHEKGQLLLVYEYMANGSLDDLLFGERRGELQWSQRYRIAIDIASALLYLHESWDKCVVHRDIKSGNILLDSQFYAKLGDFGLARLVKHDHWLRTTTMAGTLGYLAPECAVTGISNTESDVFSFGAVALEIACGRPVLDHSLESRKIRLVEWVWELYGEGRLIDAADKNLLGIFERAELEQLMVIGLWCSHPDPLSRPKIRHVLQVLNFEGSMPQLPSAMPKAIYSSLEQGFSSQSSDFSVPPDLGFTDMPR